MTVDSNSHEEIFHTIRQLFLYEKHQLPRKLGPRLFQFRDVMGFFAFFSGTNRGFFSIHQGSVSVGSM